MIDSKLGCEKYLFSCVKWEKLARMISKFCIENQHYLFKTWWNWVVCETFDDRLCSVKALEFTIFEINPFHWSFLKKCRSNFFKKKLQSPGILCIWHTIVGVDTNTNKMVFALMKGVNMETINLQHTHFEDMSSKSRWFIRLNTIISCIHQIIWTSFITYKKMKVKAE